MEPIEMKILETFILQNAEVAILDEQGEDQAPFLQKKIAKTELCPDKTHLRIYFDRRTFFAVPLTAAVTMNDSEWTAVDQQTGLKYVIRRESGLDA